jgi:GT2 family glycosyltransferase
MIPLKVDDALNSCLTQSKPLVSIIIVNYNGSRYLHKLFDSLSKQTLNDFELIIVDNASCDNSLDIIRQILSNQILFSTTILKNNENLGFCIANNKGVEIAKGDYVILLNNDTYVDKLWLEELVKRARASDNPVAVVSCIIDEDSNLPHYGNLYDIYGASLERTTSTEYDFFYGCGASLLIQRDIFEKVGGLDSAFFMYQDDPDLCWQLRLLNLKIVCAKKSICYHLKPSENMISANLKMPVLEFYLAHSRNRLRVLVKNYSYRSLLKRLPLTVVLIQLRAIILILKNRTPDYLKASIRGLLWNIRYLSSTLRERFKIQKMREVNDCSIEKYMLPYSIELRSIKFLFSGRVSDHALTDCG